VLYQEDIKVIMVFENLFKILRALSRHLNTTNGSNISYADCLEIIKDRSLRKYREIIMKIYRELKKIWKSNNFDKTVEFKDFIKESLTHILKSSEGEENPSLCSYTKPLVDFAEDGWIIV
jgi:CRISPR/Cas system Type II protein with McrA/HNH and RuvC-like nuclease domain